MNAAQVISLALLSVLAAKAQVIKPGRCPRPAVQQQFDAARVSARLRRGTDALLDRPSVTRASSTVPGHVV